MFSSEPKVSFPISKKTFNIGLVYIEELNFSKNNSKLEKNL